MIEVKSLRVDYENVRAVNDLDLTIPLGQIYGLVGPNGAGKTSTLKALAGVLEPTYGEIRLGGVDLELDYRSALRQVGFMPDFPPVYENLTAKEYLEVFGAAYLLGAKERTKQAKEWIEKVRLEGKWNAFVRDLSRGMRQRLVLARTLLHDPKIIILDEPASGLDPMGRVEMRNILKEIAREDKTIIISSHILSELSDFCNAIGIMEKGQMVVSGTVEHIRSQIGIKGTLVIHLAQSNDQIKKNLHDALMHSGLVKDVIIKSENVFEAQFIGQSLQTKELLHGLIQKGIPVSQFYLKEADFEDIFLKIGAKEVS